MVLVLEVRENTGAIRASNRQSTAARAQELALINATDPLIQRFRSEPRLESSDLTPAERSALGAFLGAHLRLAEEAYLQFLEDRLDEAYTLTRRAVVLANLDSPAARDAYIAIRSRGFLHPVFQGWIDEAAAELYGDEFPELSDKSR